MIIVIFLLICTSFHPTFILDESFTMGLIQHNFLNIINLDTMDVHPPLYYLILKTFLTIFTFWTKSVFIKVLFARIFSMLLLVFFIFIGKRVLLINNSYSLIIFLLMFSIIGRFTEIRMYALASVFIIEELHSLLRFIKYNKNIYIIYATFTAIFAFYTFYFAGLSAGIFLLIFFSRCLIYHKKNEALKLLLSGLISFLAIIPWLPIVVKQIIYHTNTDNGTNYNMILSLIFSLSQIGDHGYISIALSILIIFFFGFFIIYYMLKFSQQYYKYLLGITLINLFSTVFISLIICGRNFQSIAIYPIYTVFVFVFSVMFLEITYKINIKYVYLLCMIFITLITSYSALRIYSNIKTYDIPTMIMLKNIHYSKMINNKRIILRPKNYPISKQLTSSEYAIYLYPYHKDVILKNYSYKLLSVGLLNSTHNVKLLRAVFPNLKVRIK